MATSNQYRSGYGSSSEAQGVIGFYYTNNTNTASNACSFGYDSAYFKPLNTSHNKNNAFSVRCVMADTDTRTLTNLTYMQDTTTKICANSAENESKSLADNRDTNSYRVTKLKDGNCWMTQNLKFANGTVNGVTIPAPASSGTSVATAPQVWSNSGQDGFLYNWCAVVAISDCSSTTTEPTTSICPTGWQLPSNSGSPNFSNLFGLYGLPSSNASGNYVSTVEASPLYFTRAGLYHSGYNAQGSYGYYWSRTPNGTSNAYNFNYNTSNFNPQNNNNKNNGFSVRCVLGS